jgi:nicotinic acid phosphoribosyltransferase
MESFRLKFMRVPDGTVVLPGEPLLTVRGNVELIAHFEPLFHRIFYASMVATRAHVLSEILGDSDRFIEVGKRGAIDDHQHFLALRAMKVGGGFHLTSDDAGGEFVGINPMLARWVIVMFKRLKVKSPLFGTP